MKCPECGFENLDDAIYCIKCGNRIDGNIPCPKCGEYISGDSSFCPKCGKTIPHKKTSDEIKDNNFEARRQSISKVFNRVSFFVTLFLFIFFIGTLAQNYFVNPDRFALNELFNYIKALGDNPGAFDLTLLITRITLIGIDVIVVIPFAIFGICKLIKAHKNKLPLDNAYKYLAVVLCSRLLTTVLLLNTYSFNAASLEISSTLSSLFSFTITHFMICFAFDTFLSFRRGRVSIFIARIILSFGFLFTLLMLFAFNNLYIHIGENKVGFIYHFVSLSFNLVSNVTNAFYMSSYIFSIISLICMLLIITVSYFLVTFFTSSYFGGMPKFKRFRIMFYMGTITLAILSTIFLVSTLVETNLYSHYLTDVKIGISTLPVFEIILSIVLVGVSVATFNIYHKANSRLLLEEKTTKI